MVRTWTKIAKPSGTSWTKIAKPTTGSTTVEVATLGSPIGLLMALTYSSTQTITVNNHAWTKITKPSGTSWTKIAKGV